MNSRPSTLRRALRAAPAAFTLALGACAAAAQGRGGGNPGRAIAEMVAAERAFSARSAADGVRDAFLAYLADDGILFRPGPVNGKEFFQSRPAPPVVLTWRPSHAAISCAGDLGFTFGPYVSRPREGGEGGQGHYYTLWRRQPDGTWKFVLDLGTPNPAPAVPFPDWSPGGELPCGVPGPADEAGLRDADAAFSREWEGGGAAAALRAWADPGVVVGRAGAPPAEGMEAAARAAARDEGRDAWTPAAAHLSADGSLGYVYGAYTRSGGGGPALAGNYVREWRRTPAGWRLLLDVVAARPAQPQANATGP